jgi:uncharacterized protein (DUF1501 family)
MKRRSFLKSASIATAGTIFIPSFLQAYESELTFLSNPNSPYKRLIVIQLSGGNDGLNTIIPYKNNLYYENRPTIGLKENKIIKLTDELGINSLMPEIADLYNGGELSIVNNVGYPNPNRSHFRSMDIWHSASNSKEYLTTGWLGRFMDNECQHAHQVMELDNTLSMANKGINSSGIALKNPQNFHKALNHEFYNNVANLDKDLLDEDNLGYLYKTLIDTKQSSTYIKEKFEVQSESNAYPKTNLGNQLSTVAACIKSGIDTKVYYTSLGGFDTHVNQVAKQSGLLKTYSQGVNALVKDLKKSGKFNETLILTFSEFGRRVKQNASNGTDHGQANNLFIIGKNLKKAGFVNENPDLEHLSLGDLKYSVDFRNVYLDVIENWFNVDSKRIITSKFDRNPLNII